MTDKAIQDERIALAEEVLTLFKAELMTRLAWAEELDELIKADARHDPALHQTEEAKRDTGEFEFCRGCRAITLSRRIYGCDVVQGKGITPLSSTSACLWELEARLDDDGRYGVKAVMERLTEQRKAKEAPKE